MHRDRLLELEHHPALVPRRGHPATAIAILTVVDVLQFVHTSRDEVPRRRRLRARRAESHVSAIGVEDLELVDARLVGIRFEDRESQPARRHGRDAVGVEIRRHGRAAVAGAGERLVPWQLAVDLPDPFPDRLQLLANGDGLRGFEHPLAVFDPGEEGLQRVVVAGGDGIELVIVAAGAADGKAQDRV